MVITQVPRTIICYMIRLYSPWMYFWPLNSRATRKEGKSAKMPKLELIKEGFLRDLSIGQLVIMKGP